MMSDPTLPDDKGDNGLGAWTPGPWRVGAEWPQIVAIYDARRIYIAHAETGAGGNWIGANPLGRDVAQANALLIAASPELFEALDGLLSAVNTNEAAAFFANQNPVLFSNIEDAIGPALAALAKAQGK